ncbi:MAG: ORF6N domain-containing protein [Bacilli bacterium]|nr:ORF6N domain-containing protein [Bacilli bacterium]
MQKLITKENNIKNMIYEIRGKQVMLDSDLAKLYGYSSGTKAFNQAVNRNIERFPERFRFRLTKEEYNNILRSQSVTLEPGRYSKYLPYVFTEQGVAMLSSVLRTSKATEVSINIMDAFVGMRNFISNNSDIFNRLTKVEYKLLENDEKIDILFNKLDEKREIKEKLFYDGQIYDAYSLLINIIMKAKEKIIIIDNYIDKTILDILIYKNEKVKVEIWTRNIKCDLDIEKFNLQYENVNIKKVNNIHDRFIILDNKELYHVGASLKDLGKKCFAINKMNEENIKLLIKTEK